MIVKFLRVLPILVTIAFAAANGVVGYVVGYERGVNTPCADEESFDIRPMQ